jgi:3D (Asp-Asp-Asp) domain-containing protein
MRRKRPIRQRHRKTLLRLLALAAAFAAGWFFPKNTKPVRTMLVTAYCNCEICCQWARNKDGIPIFLTGPLKGKPKKIGVTASGKTAQPGTAAVRPGALPFGTRIHIENTGLFRIEDHGALARDQIDIWFPTHEEARRWGRKKLKVTVLERP